MSAVRCVLFDLDGTLVDTAPDLAHCVNLLRTELAMPALALALIRPYVSHGARGLIRGSFELAEHDDRFEALRTRLLDLYQDHCTRDCRLFSGMDEVLDTLDTQQIPWGVVTNKPARFTSPVMDTLGLARRAACVVSGDSTPYTKPRPEPLLHASRDVGVPPAQCLYVGDARRDIEAGRSAGMQTLVALFGYLDRADRPEEWQADGLVDEPSAILAWMTRTGRDAVSGRHA